MIFVYIIYGLLGIMLLFLLIGCLIGIVRTCTLEVPDVPTPLQAPPAPPAPPPKKSIPEIVTVVVVQPDGHDYALGRLHQVNG
jgi:hypothetical protein